MQFARLLLVVGSALLPSLPGLCQTPEVPPEAAFMAHWGVISHREENEAWGVATVPAYGEHQVQKYGRHWNLFVRTPGFADRPSLWAAVKPAVLQAGWTVVSENPNGGLLVVLHYSKGGVDAWANASTANDATTFEMNVIEVVPPPIALALREPAAAPETVGPQADFPYLPPLPGSEVHQGSEDAAPFRVTPRGADAEEIVANGSNIRNYVLKGLSQVLFSTVYRDALVKAGWEIEREAGTEVTVANYHKNGRNLWAYLLCHGSDYSLRVGKEAAPDQMRAALASQCHLALYGVLFDFNKSTLRPASDGPLQQVAALLAANPSLSIEVQGHTDNVGGDEYNRKLSEARAGSVMSWLTKHGVAARRITAKGYGKTNPVADNATDEGRMKNRRVEIADPRCERSGK